MSWHLRGLGSGAPAALKPAARGLALRRRASSDALLAAPPFPWLRPPRPRICGGTPASSPSRRADSGQGARVFQRREIAWILARVDGLHDPAQDLGVARARQVADDVHRLRTQRLAQG